MEHLSKSTKNTKAQVLADTLDQATGKFLDSDKSPSRKAGELDNRGSHFYLALYWAEALAHQSTDKDLQAHFAPIAQQLAKNETEIVQELNAAQGHPVDIGGYYRPDEGKTARAMCPSVTFNAILGGTA